MADVIWTSAAFTALEELPQPIAFGIFQQTEYLQRFPEIGSQISQSQHLSKYRQLTTKRNTESFIGLITPRIAFALSTYQNCRQKLPTARQTKRALKDEGGLPLE